MRYELGFVLVSVLAHANARMPGRLERLRRRLIVTPDLHRVHPSAIARDTGGNFGSILAWWGRLFGSHRDQPEAGHEGMRNLEL